MSKDVTGRLNRLLQEISTETVLLHQTIADRLGLNLTDHKALGLVLDAGKPITPGHLAARTGLTTGAITGILDRLERAGFVRRKRDPEDRRQVLIEVNRDRVRRKVLPLFAPLEKRMNAVAATFSQHDLDAVIGFLEKGLAVSREHRVQLRD